MNSTAACKRLLRQARSPLSEPQLVRSRRCEQTEEPRTNVFPATRRSSHQRRPRHAALGGRGAPAGRSLASSSVLPECAASRLLCTSAAIQPTQNGRGGGSHSPAAVTPPAPRTRPPPAARPAPCRRCARRARAPGCAPSLAAAAPAAAEGRGRRGGGAVWDTRMAGERRRPGPCRLHFCMCRQASLQVAQRSRTTRPAALQNSMQARLVVSDDQQAHGRALAPQSIDRGRHIAQRVHVQACAGGGAARECRQAPTISGWRLPWQEKVGPLPAGTRRIQAPAAR